MDHTTRRVCIAAIAAAASLSLLSAACGRAGEPNEPAKQPEPAPAVPPPQPESKPSAPKEPGATKPAEGQPGAPASGGSAGTTTDVFEVLPREKTEPLRGDPIVHTRFAFAKGIRYTIPRGWEVEAPSNSMRISQYRLTAPKDSGLADGQAVVSGGIGGSIDDNLRRWAAQMKGGQKKPTRLDLLVGDLVVSEIEATGTYEPGMAMAGAPPVDPLPGAMMLGAIIDNGPEGLVFIKATGPEAVMRAHRKAWDTLVRSVSVAPDPRPKGAKP